MVLLDNLFAEYKCKKNHQGDNFFVDFVFTDFSCWASVVF